jgi:glycosyltransferase involved in cell wall biosynthesis
MSESTHLLHSDFFDAIPLTGDITRDAINERASKLAAHSTVGLQPVTIVIRTLNEQAGLEALFEDIADQAIGADSQVIVVDNESTDRTVDVAESYGATVVTIPRGLFTYPISMNKGVEAADNDVVFLTVGHARLSNKRLVHATANALREKNVAGVYGTALPSSTVSTSERLIAIGNVFYASKSKKIEKAGMGVLQAVCAAVSKQAWEELGRFDERYESGGEDTALAAKMIQSGKSVIREPLLSVYHSHGLGPIDTAKQWIHWARTVRGPVPLDIKKLQNRRPDLNL